MLAGSMLELAYIAKYNLMFFKGQYTYDVQESCLIFKTPHHLCPSTSKTFHPLNLGRLNETFPHPPQKAMESQPHRASK